VDIYGQRVKKSSGFLLQSYTVKMDKQLTPKVTLVNMTQHREEGLSYWKAELLAGGERVGADTYLGSWTIYERVGPEDELQLEDPTQVRSRWDFRDLKVVSALQAELISRTSGEEGVKKPSTRRSR
jgi:hypothetical protein